MWYRRSTFCSVYNKPQTIAKKWQAKCLEKNRVLSRLPNLRKSPLKYNTHDLGLSLFVVHELDSLLCA